MTRRGRVAVGVLAGLFLLSSVAFAALPLAVMLPAIADFGAGLVLSTLSRTVLVNLGLEGTWVGSLAVLAARSLGMVRLASHLSGVAVTYEIPTLPDTAIPRGEVDSKPPADGALGTFNNPLSYDAPGVVITVTGAYVCGILSADGLIHSIPSGSKFRGSAALVAACNEATVNPVADDPHTYFAWTSVYDPHDQGPMLVYKGTDQYFIDRIGLCAWYRADQGESPGGRCGVWNINNGLSISLEELPDNVKRFTRGTTGFTPDASDPDWTAEEKLLFSSPSTIKFVDPAGSVLVASANATSTKLQAFAQNGLDVLVRSVELNNVAVPLRNL